MDALYLFGHSINHDLELRYSLRSLAQHAPYLRKVWIFGDKPAFISEDTTIVETVPHAATAGVLGVRTPVENFFLLLFLAAQIPDLSSEFLRMSDDYFLLQSYPLEEAVKTRYLKDLAQTRNRGTGRWQAALWRTHDLLKRLGYPVVYNFESHTPAYFKKQWIIDAYAAFQPYAAEDQLQGLRGNTEILNLAYKTYQMPLTNLREENSREGFWRKAPTLAEVTAQIEGKTFFNCDDEAFGGAIQTFLAGRFPTPCRYEKA